MSDIRVFALGYRYLNGALQKYHASPEEAFAVCSEILDDFEKSSFKNPYEDFDESFAKYMNSYNSSADGLVRVSGGQTAQDSGSSNKSGSDVLVSRYFVNVE